jgi:DMSO/TMAO reductase YedYZ molybdopterin-dependent catalytic subunit
MDTTTLVPFCYGRYSPKHTFFEGTRRGPVVNGKSAIKSLVTRRKLITAGASAIAAPVLSGCEQISDAPQFRSFLELGRAASLRVQRLLLARQPLAREYTAADISPDFPPNGTAMPPSPQYRQMMMRNFESWSLVVHGLVRRPQTYALEEIRGMPARTQITMHNCDEGWSAIAQWTGVPLRHILQQAELAPEARYVVFYCVDELVRTADRSGFYYESLDLFDALHPQTILAYTMNGKPLPVRHGAPLRLRVERQVGYKHAKFLNRIEVVDRLDRIGKGKGGFWEDRGYQWYAGL